MVKRHSNIGFAGGALVFPGGKIDDADKDSAWEHRASGLSDDPVIALAMIAAVRETFEEVGILLARDEDGLIDEAKCQTLEHWRGPVEKNADLFIRMIEENNLTLACDQLVLFARWVAPPRVPNRFDTWFFIARSPTNQCAHEDGNEATEAIWITPQDATTARDNGSRFIIFPTARNVELLGVSGSVEEAITAAGGRKIEPIIPKIEDGPDGKVLTIPKDLGYPITEESIETAFKS